MICYDGNVASYACFPLRMTRRGIALMTALMLITFLLIVGLGFLTMLEQDYNLGAQQVKGQQAYLLAQSGIDYYKARPTTFTVDVPKALNLPEGDPDRVFEVVVKPDGTIRSSGRMLHDGKVQAERILVVPQGNYGEMYDETQ